MIKIFKVHQAVAREKSSFPRGYETIGSITVSSEGDLEKDLSEAKNLTTSNGKPWYTNRTAYIVHTKARSIESGDVLEENGKFYQLLDDGFIEIKGK